MSLKHIKLFESFVGKVNEEYEKPDDFPGTPFKGTEKEKKEKEAGETWNGYDKNGYPKYTNESAKRWKAFMDDAIKNDKGVIIKIGEDKAILAVKYKNGLYYFVKNIDLSDLPEKPEDGGNTTVVTKKVIKEIDALKQTPIIAKSIPLEPMKAKTIKIMPLKALIKGDIQKQKVRRDASGKKIKSLSLVGDLNKEVSIGYAIEGGLYYFNDHKGNAWRYNSETGEKEKVDKVEVGLDKYKTPDKKGFKQFLDKHNIK